MITIKLEKKKIFYGICGVINIIFFLMVTTILILNFFIDHKVNYACKNIVEIPNIILLFIGILALIILFFVYNKYIKKYVDMLNVKQCNILLVIYCIVLFLLQVYLARNIYFLTGWDAGILRESAVGIANGQVIDGNFGYYWYYSMYPNNIFLTFIFSLIYQISNWFKMINFEFLLVIFSIISVNISLFFTVKCAAILFKNKSYCIWIIFLYTIFIALSPWIVIPYSDTYSIIFTVGALYFYLSRDKMNIYFSWFMIFIMSLLGYLIKPTCIIVLIAIIIIELWKILFSDKKIIVKKLKVVPTILISICAFFIINMYAVNYVGYESNETLEFPMTHFLMMGMNSETKGVYFEEDVQFTKSIVGSENKKRANLDVVRTRIENYGFCGYLDLLMNKMLTNYNDGTFAWSVEGNFYSVTFEDSNNQMTQILRDIYYYDGQYYNAFATYQQTVWILVLFLLPFAFFRLCKLKNFNLQVIVLTIIGITLFLLLFEARARYLFLYSPYYLILSVLGIQQIKSLFKYVRNRR